MEQINLSQNQVTCTNRLVAQLSPPSHVVTFDLDHMALLVILSHTCAKQIKFLTFYYMQSQLILIDNNEKEQSTVVFQRPPGEMSAKMVFQL